MSKPPSPATDNIRLTITVSPEVHDAFTRMAEASGMSLGRCMGEWLQDTLEGVEFLTAQLLRARQAPRQVVKEMRAMAMGAADLADEVLADLRSGKAQPAAAGRDAGGTRPAAADAPPRLVIRGGKSTRTNTKGRK